MRPYLKLYPAQRLAALCSLVALCATTSCALTTDLSELGYVGPDQGASPDMKPVDMPVDEDLDEPLPPDMKPETPGALIISEIIEGKNNNKVIELYNASNEPVTLSQYTLLTINSFSDTNGPLQTDRVLEPGQLFVVCNPGIEEGYESVCDLLDIKAANFNGDDPIVLFRDGELGPAGSPNGDEVVDAFGKIDEKPDNSIWSDRILRRCDLTPYDGTGAFNVDSYFKTITSLDDFSNIGVAPTPGC